MGNLLLRRYEIRRVLGKGGTGTVYEAFDTETRAMVALKAVESSIAENLYRLKHEFRALADVQHQNLVHFGELASEDGKWFFTMELIAGEPFSDYVRPQNDAPVAPRRLAADGTIDDDVQADVVTRTVLRAWAPAGAVERSAITVVPHSGPTFDEPRLRATLAQLVDALSVLHAAGHVHRDVKPGNVLVTRDGRVVLLDFGLVTELASREQVGSDMSGTPAFMAPEQIRGESLGPPADWYALGVMLYHALTGSLPFTGPVGAVLEAKLEREAPAPHDQVAQVPRDLDQLCIDLLRRDASARPLEDEIRARLGLPARAHQAPATSAEGAPFVGRTVEQDVLAGALRAVHAGEARALVVEGEPGVGKTALVQEFLARITPRPVILTGRCYEQEDVPFKGVDSIIDALSVHLLGRSPAELERLLAGGVRYLAAVFPVLNRVPAIRAATSAARGVANQAGLREQAFGELARLFASLAHDRLLVVFLDDLQWVDGDSLAVLERAILPASGTTCLFLATLRSGLEVAPRVAKVLEHAQRLVLGGLSRDESGSLWDRLRAGPAGGETDSERGAAVHEAAGHPLFLAELARAAQEGRFNRQGGALLDVLRDRIGRHDPIERAFLEMAAVAGAPTPYAIVARAAGLDVGECLTRIGGLKAAQLLRVTLEHDDTRCVEPYHDRIREAIMEPLRRDGRHAPLQLRLGRALLDAEGAEDEPRDPARVFAIVQHLNAAHALIESPAERLRLAELNLAASREARQATAYDNARAYARSGVALLGDAGWTDHYALTRDLHMARFDAELLADDVVAAHAVFAAARPRMATTEDVAALWALRVVLETSCGRFREALVAGREALAELRMPLPARVTRAKVLEQYARTRWAQGRRSLAELAALPPLEDAHLRGALQLLVACIPAAFFLDTHLLTWLNMRVAEESMRHGVCPASPYGLAGYGLVLAGAFGQREEGQGFGRLALELNERVGSPARSSPLYMQNGGFICHWVRPFAEARALLHRGHELAQKHGDAAYEVYCATILSVVTFCESAELATVQEVGTWAREVGLRRRDRDMALVPELHARQAAALRGLTPSALDLGTSAQSDAELRAGMDDKRYPVALYYYHHVSAELAYLAGDSARAAALLAGAAARTQGIFALPTMVELAFLQVLVAARRHDGAGPREKLRLVAAMVQGVRRLRAWAKSCPENYEAHALIATGELQRVLGRTHAAELSLRRAAAVARGNGSAKREAFALELSARLAADRGDAEAAGRLRKDAAASYRRWGAITKADALR